MRTPSLHVFARAGDQESAPEFLQHIHFIQPGWASSSLLRHAGWAGPARPCGALRLGHQGTLIINRFLRGGPGSSACSSLQRTWGRARCWRREEKGGFSQIRTLRPTIGSATHTGRDSRKGRPILSGRRAASPLFIGLNRFGRDRVSELACPLGLQAALAVRPSRYRPRPALKAPLGIKGRECQVGSMGTSAPGRVLIPHLATV